MTWKPKEHLTVYINRQYRLQLTLEKQEMTFEDVFVDQKEDSRQFASSLLDALGDHLSRRNLQDIINECQKRLERWG